MSKISLYESLMDTGLSKDEADAMTFATEQGVRSGLKLGLAVGFCAGILATAIVRGVFWP